jgi:3-deoxy-manno-octulosonate cytidylyltransferase (CMP-KDO synthetase)
MIQHVYENTSKTSGLDRVLVATDDLRIFKAVRAFGGEAVLTSRSHLSGTDKLAEVAAQMKAAWVVNVQGDLPFIRPQTIGRILRPLRLDPSVPMATAKTPIYDRDEWTDPNVVKVVTDRQGFALYFSRAPIPYHREPAGKTNNPDSSRPSQRARLVGYRHLGVYVYRRDFLLRFSGLRPTSLEQSEGLEQLRPLAYGYRIRVMDVEETSVEVNTPADLVQAENYLRLEGGRTSHG